jgi:hypothetical protein
VVAASNAAPPELAPYYYRDNFNSLCDAVEAQYDDVLLPIERDFLRRYQQLSQQAQCLYVRLLTRVGPNFRLQKLKYPEIGDLAPAVSALVESGHALPITALSLDELGRLYNKAELLQALGSRLDTGVGISKSDLLDTVAALGMSADEHYALMGAPALLAIQGGQLLQLLQLLFFGNRYQSLTDFILSDLGLRRYYSYPLNRHSRLFRSRGAVDEYLGLCDLSDSFYELLDNGQRDSLETLGRELLANTVVFSSSMRRLEKLLNRVARELERDDRPELALELYGLSSLPPARERSARILESLENWSGASSLCRQMLEEPRCESEREAAARIDYRVQRKSGLLAARQARDSFDELRLSLLPSDDSVERIVARHLMATWPAVHFVENKLMNALFGLAFWEQIFSGLEGAFHNPFQSVPADMYSGDFYRPRSGAIEQRLRELSEADLQEELLESYGRFHGYQCRWVDWQSVTAGMVEQALGVIPAQHLLAIWQRQLFDPGENRNGFPDLIAFGTHSGDYSFIEVKGPGDKLQDNQKRWLRFFSRNSIPATVAWVTWSDD